MPLGHKLSQTVVAGLRVDQRYANSPGSFRVYRSRLSLTAVARREATPQSPTSDGISADPLRRIGVQRANMRQHPVAGGTYGRYAVCMFARGDLDPVMEPPASRLCTLVWLMLPKMNGLSSNPCCPNHLPHDDWGLG